jgi:predicted DNA binding CopG/RHH family protein
MKKLSEMTDDELLAASDEVERQARDRSQWTETAESKSNESQREAWLEDNTVPITMRIPKSMLVVLRAIAAAEGIGYQTLIKKWLHRDLLTLAKSRGEKKQETLLRSLEGEGKQKEQLMASLASPLLRRG